MSLALNVKRRWSLVFKVEGVEGLDRGEMESWVEEGEGGGGVEVKEGGGGIQGGDGREGVDRMRIV